MSQSQAHADPSASDVEHQSVVAAAPASSELKPNSLLLNRQLSRSQPFGLNHDERIRDYGSLHHSLHEHKRSASFLAEEVSVGDAAPMFGRPKRTGDTISSHRAVMTLAKSMFNAGCFSLPFAWMSAGLWSAFALTFVVAALNWYGNHVLVKTAQHMAAVLKSPALDYGHFTKKVLDLSAVPHLQRNSKRYMYVVNITILFYQLGMCSVSLLFISRNIQKVVLDYSGEDISLWVFASGAFLIVLATNMTTRMRIISIYALLSTIFFLVGVFMVLGYCVSLPSQWRAVPASTDFMGTVTFIGMAMYAFEGQTMILPIENKLEHPEDFLQNCGVLPTTMLLCTALMTAVGFYGYTAFGVDTASTVTLNLPKGYSAVNVCLMLQSLLGHSIAMYVVFDMFWAGFARKFPRMFPWWDKHLFALDKCFRTFWVFITYVMAIGLPKLDILIPLVGTTSGTLCALVYPPLLQTITMYRVWHRTGQLYKHCLINGALVALGLTTLAAGVYVNGMAVIRAFSDEDPYAVGHKNSE